MNPGLKALALVSMVLVACDVDLGGGNESTSEGGDTEATTGGAAESTEGGAAESTSSTSEGAAESTSEGGAESTSEGAGESTTGGPEGGVVEACGLPMPCEGYYWDCDPDGVGADCGGVPYSDGLICMLQTLAAGESGQFYVSFNGLASGEVEWVDVAVYGPEAALYQHTQEDWDFSLHPDPAQKCTPKPPEWFEACLADTGDAAQHTSCMNTYEWFEGCSEATECL
jgi:hypothetical protein